jgi:PAS domain S-box-containing protein
MLRYALVGRGRIVESASPKADLLQAIFDQVTEGVVAVDRNGKPLAFSSAAARILRLGQTTIAQWSDHGSFYLPDRTTLCPAEQLPIVRALRGETVREAVLFVRFPEVAEGFWVSVNAQPMRGAQGAVEGAIAVFRDISETQRAKIALRHSEELCRTLIENMQEVVAVLSATGNIMFVSPAIETTLGYTPRELLGRNAFDLVHPEDLPRALAIFRAGVERPGTLEEEDFRVRHKDGSWRYFAGAGKNLLENPEVGGMVVTGREVTARVQAEQQALFQTSLLEHLRSAVVELDTEGTIIYWNNFARSLCQWATEEVLGKRLLDIAIPRRGHDRYNEVLQAVQATGYWEGEFSAQRRDGTIFPVFLTVTSVRDRRGALVGYVGVAIDITERKEAEQRLRTSREQLRRLAARNQSIRETERTRISRDIHDDLGQQLTALKMDLSHLARDLGGRAAARDLAPDVASAIRIVDSSIKSVQRIAAELRPSVLDDLGLSAAIECQLQEFQSRTGIRSSIRRTDGDLPLDPERSTGVFRIFQEILTNIARHAQASAVKVRIEQQAGCLTLNVRDNGRGITRQQIVAPGSLGLLGMRERALRLGGKLSVQGVCGKGTWVSLRVPIAGREADCAEDTDRG